MWKYEFNLIPNQLYWTFPLAYNWEMYDTLIVDENLRKIKNNVVRKDKVNTFERKCINLKGLKLLGGVVKKVIRRCSKRCTQYGH